MGRWAWLGMALVGVVSCAESLPGLDAGDLALDAQVVEAGIRDADVGGDAGSPDRMIVDGATPDAGYVDASASDAGSVDAATPDAGPEGCAVAGFEGLCVEVGECASPAGFRGVCAGPPSRTCCVPDDPPCSVDGAPGLCVDVADCGFVSTPGRCPGPANIQCCADPAEACDETRRPAPNEGLTETSWDAACPDGMVTVTNFCIDKFEASLVVVDASGVELRSWSPFHPPQAELVAARSIEGAVPQGYASGLVAEAACARAGKRLCTDDEWLTACRGPNAHVYPYGSVRESGRCNDARDRHPAIEFFGTSADWIWSELGNACINQIPAALALTGQYSGCESAHGALDMMGNLHEWTSDPSGTFRGGFYADTRINGDGCLYRTTAHSRGHWDYSTGFRCCASPR